MGGPAWPGQSGLLTDAGLGCCSAGCEGAARRQGVSTTSRGMHLPFPCARPCCCRPPGVPCPVCQQRFRHTCTPRARQPRRWAAQPGAPGSPPPARLAVLDHLVKVGGKHVERDVVAPRPQPLLHRPEVHRVLHRKSRGHQAHVSPGTCWPGSRRSESLHWHGRVAAVSTFRGARATPIVNPLAAWACNRQPRRAVQGACSAPQRRLHERGGPSTAR